METEEERLLFCAEVNSKMGFTSLNLKLTPQNVKYDEKERKHYKTLLNAVGEISFKMLHSKSFQVEDLPCLSSKVCQVKSTALQQRHKISHKTNCAITAFNAAYSRIEMHKDIELLLHAGMTPTYFDTDGIMWSQRESTPSPPMYMELLLVNTKMKLMEKSTASILWVRKKNNT